MVGENDVLNELYGVSKSKKTLLQMTQRQYDL